LPPGWIWASHKLRDFLRLDLLRLGLSGGHHCNGVVVVVVFVLLFLLSSKIPKTEGIYAITFLPEIIVLD